MTETLRRMEEGNGVTGVEVQRANEARTRLFRRWRVGSLISISGYPTTRAAIAADHDPREPITLDENRRRATCILVSVYPSF